jgi:hypothetical protein
MMCHNCMLREFLLVVCTNIATHDTTLQKHGRKDKMYHNCMLREFLLVDCTNIVIDDTTLQKHGRKDRVSFKKNNMMSYY